ncbi:MAG: TonB C-terminal domain-containing protein [Polyangiaceae bacterium]
MLPARKKTGPSAPREPGFLAEYPPSDILIALGSASLFLLATAIGLKASAAERPESVSLPEKTTEAPVKVIPVIDLEAPLLKLGGKPDPTRLPDRWVKKSAKARVEQKAQVSTAADKSIESIPTPDLPVAEKPLPPAPPDAEVTKQVDAPVVPTSAPSPPSNVPVEGHQDGVAEGTETDPLKARAVDLYRARIVGWFAGRFRVSNSGLSAEDLLKYKVGATVEISADRTVGGYTLSPSGNAAFDAAAKAALDGAKGQSLPPPPDNYPDIVQSRIRLTFVCKEHRCD